MVAGAVLVVGRLSLMILLTAGALSTVFTPTGLEFETVSELEVETSMSRLCFFVLSSLSRLCFFSGGAPLELVGATSFFLGERWEKLSIKIFKNLKYFFLTHISLIYDKIT